MKKYIISAFIFTMIFIPSFGMAQQSTIEQLNAQIQSLLQTILALQEELDNLSNQTVPQPPSPCVVLTSNLYLGLGDSDTGNDVTRLQTFLAVDTSVYPEGLITGFFGPLTEQAVKRWQSANGVVSSGTPDTTGYGVVGPNTRAAMSQGCATTPTPTPPPTISPNITITSPVTGSVYRPGDVMRITWNRQGFLPNNIQIRFGQGSPTPVIATLGSVSRLYYDYLIPASTPTGENYYISVCDSGIRIPANTVLCSGSPSNPKISIRTVVTEPNPTIISTSTASTITAIYPAGGETLNINATTTLKGSWTNMQSLSFALYKNGTFYKWIVPNIVPGCSTTCAGGGLYNWMPSNTIPASEVGTQNKFKVLFQGYDSSGGVYNTFTNEFGIVDSTSTTPTPSTITVAYPNGGEQVSSKDDFITTWKSPNVSGTAYVYLNFADGRYCFLGTAPFSQGYFTAILDPGYPCSGTATTTVTNGQYKVLIDTDANQNNNISGGYDFSDNYFTLTDSITTTSTITAVYPAGGETLNANTTTTLRGSWTNMKFLSFALYKNGIFYKWIKQSFVPGCTTTCAGGGLYNWVPSSTIPASETGTQHAFKIFFQGVGFNGQTYSTFTNEFKIGNTTNTSVTANTSTSVNQLANSLEAARRLLDSMLRALTN